LSCIVDPVVAVVFSAVNCGVVVVVVMFVSWLLSASHLLDPEYTAVIVNPSLFQLFGIS